MTLKETWVQCIATGKEFRRTMSQRGGEVVPEGRLPTKEMKLHRQIWLIFANKASEHRRITKKHLPYSRLAAEKDYVPAQASLGIMYALGKGVPRDDTEAYKWIYPAAQKGWTSAQY